MSSEYAGADRLTQEALSNWYVRLLANAISYTDASNEIPRVKSWRDCCSLWIERAALREIEAEEMAGRAGVLVLQKVLFAQLWPTISPSSFIIKI